MLLSPHIPIRHSRSHSADTTNIRHRTISPPVRALSPPPPPTYLSARTISPTRRDPNSSATYVQNNIKPFWAPRFSHANQSPVSPTHSPLRNENGSPSLFLNTSRESPHPSDRRAFTLSVTPNGSPTIAGSPMKRNGSIDVCVRTEQGRRPYQEDTTCTKYISDDRRIFGVFDGHGGKAASMFCKQFMLDTLSRMLEQGVNCNHALHNVFNLTEQQFMDIARQQGLKDGTTALVLCLWDGWMHVAHCGDTRLIVVQDGMPNWSVLTQDHRPDLSREYQRVTQTGAQIIQGPGDVPRLVPGGLAVTRSIGDISCKQQNSLALIAEPDVISVPIKSSFRYIVMATDGLWDVITPQDCASICLKSVSAAEAAELLVQSGLSKGSQDNITVIVIQIRTQQCVHRYD